MGVEAAGATGEGDRPIRENVVLLSMRRTGSTMVTNALNHHPDICFIGALFNRPGWGGNGKGRRELHRRLSPAWDELDYRLRHSADLMALYFGHDRDTAVKGFKHHLEEWPEATQAIVADAALPKIVLTRANMLACYSSEKIAEITRRSQAPPGGKVAFVPAEFDRFVGERERWYRHWMPAIAASGAPLVEIDYAEARTAAGITRLLSFLGIVAGADLAAPTTVKRNPDIVVERFSDPRAVERFLAARGLTRWAVEEPAAGE